MTTPANPEPDAPSGMERFQPEFGKPLGKDVQSYTDALPWWQPANEFYIPSRQFFARPIASPAPTAAVEPPCSVCSGKPNSWWLSQGYKWCEQCHRDFMDTKAVPCRHEWFEGKCVHCEISIHKVRETQQDEVIRLRREIETLYARLCPTCHGHGLVGRMTPEGGEGFPCPQCSGTEVIQQWRAMDTAPKDGAEFIGLMKGGLILITWWQRYSTFETSSQATEGYYSWTCRDRDSQCPYEPIGWIPIPEPLK